MTTKEKAELMLSYEPGQQWQWKWRDEDVPNAPWHDYSGEPIWAWDDYTYRRKPSPKLRAWRPEEVPVGALIRRKEKNTTRAVILGLDALGDNLDSCVLWPGRNGTWLRDDFQNCLRLNEHSLDGGKTWLPCGVITED